MDNASIGVASPFFDVDTVGLRLTFCLFTHKMRQKEVTYHAYHLSFTLHPRK